MTELDYEVRIARVGWWWRTGKGRWRWSLTYRRAERAAARHGSHSAQLIAEARKRYG